MSLEPLPPKLEQGVSQFAKQSHLSHDEAVLELLSTALDHVSLSRQKPKLGLGHKPSPTPPNLEIAKKKSIIGMFANDPEFDRTMDAVVASRALRYAVDG